MTSPPDVTTSQVWYWWWRGDAAGRRDASADASAEATNRTWLCWADASTAASRCVARSWRRDRINCCWGRSIPANGGYHAGNCQPEDRSERGQTGDDVIKLFFRRHLYCPQAGANTVCRCGRSLPKWNTFKVLQSRVGYWPCPPILFAGVAGAYPSETLLRCSTLG